MNRRSAFKLFFGGIGAWFCRGFRSQSTSNEVHRNYRFANRKNYEDAMEYYRKVRPYFEQLSGQYVQLYQRMACPICNGGALGISNDGLRQMMEVHQKHT